MLSLELPVEMLVSILNTYLRSKYQSLCDLCENEDLYYNDLIQKLVINGYIYNETTNQIKKIN